MLYLVDGYNVTHSDPATRGLALEEQREALVSRLRVRGSGLLGKGRIVVVFDGQGGEGLSSAGGTAGVEVRYSRDDESADDVIVHLASAATGGVCVVSSDGGLIARVRSHAPRGVSVETRDRASLFEAASPPRRGRSRGRYPAASAGIPAGGNRITEELKALWLTGEDTQDEKKE